MTNGEEQKRYSPSDYSASDRLYRSYRSSELNEGMDTLELNAISLPDYSVNWSSFSKPEDVLKREGGLPTDGCFSFSVETAQFEEMATPCHDPLPDNYSHTEVRQLKPDEPLDFEPPKKRRIRTGKWKRLKMAYKQNVVNCLTIEFEPTA